MLYIILFRPVAHLVGYPWRLMPCKSQASHFHYMIIGCYYRLSQAIGPSQYFSASSTPGDVLVYHGTPRLLMPGSKTSNATNKQQVRLCFVGRALACAFHRFKIFLLSAGASYWCLLNQIWPLKQVTHCFRWYFQQVNQCKVIW